MIQRWLLIFFLVVGRPWPTFAAEAVPGLNDVPLSQLIEVMVADRKMLAFDAQSGGQMEVSLRLKEELLWLGSQGAVGGAITDQRVLLVGVGSSRWRVINIGLTENVNGEALLGDRVVLVVTNRRVMGFGGDPPRVSEVPLGIHEEIQARRVGENVGLIVTNRRGLGFSPLLPGFVEVELDLKEKIESVSAAANLATLRTNRRILIFRSSSSSWEERTLNLQN